MSTERSFTIEARIDHLSEGVGCFDPIQVVQRLRGAFPEIIEPSRDYLGQTYEDLRKIDAASGALRVSIRDMQERGPKIQFEIPASGGHSFRGTAERYWVLVTSKEEFPEDFRRRFIAFLNSLRLQPIQIRFGQDLS
jgi:hypothetical protein